MSAICVKCAKKKGLLSIYLLFLKYVYTYCKCFDNNTHAVFGISVMFGKKCHCFIFKKKKKSVVYIMYIFLLVFVTIICFSMVLESMKKPENLFVCLEYDINGNVKINSQPCWGCVGVQWHAVGLK